MTSSLQLQTNCYACLSLFWFFSSGLGTLMRSLRVGCLHVFWSFLRWFGGISNAVIGQASNVCGAIFPSWSERFLFHDNTWIVKLFIYLSNICIENHFSTKTNSYRKARNRRLTVENLLKPYLSALAPANYFFSGYFSFSFTYFRNFRNYYRFSYWYC